MQIVLSDRAEIVPHFKASYSLPSLEGFVFYLPSHPEASGAQASGIDGRNVNQRHVHAENQPQENTTLPKEFFGGKRLCGKSDAIVRGPDRSSVDGQGCWRR